MGVLWTEKQPDLKQENETMSTPTKEAQKQTQAFFWYAACHQLPAGVRHGRKLTFNAFLQAFKTLHIQLL